MKKIKIYSNKRNVKHLKRIFLALEVGKKKRMRRLTKKRGLNRKRDGALTRKEERKKRALKLKEREGWNREFFSIYFFPIFSEKIMVNSFVLDLIFSMN